MLKVRPGDKSETEVKIPSPGFTLVMRSSQWTKITLFRAPAGRQEFMYAILLPENWALPFELRFTLLNVEPYRLTGNGSVTDVTQSSQWFPISVVHAAIAPVDDTMA